MKRFSTPQDRNMLSPTTSLNPDRTANEACWQSRIRLRYWGASTVVLVALANCSSVGEQLAMPLDETGQDSSGGTSNSGPRNSSGGSADSQKSSSIGGRPHSTDIGISVSPTTEPDSSPPPDPNAKCGSVQVDAQAKTIETVVETPGNVLFVFDQSDSMGELWQSTQKWKAANDAVVAAFTPHQNKLSAGAVLFPMGTNSACDPTVDLVGCILGGGLGLCPDVAPITTPPQMQFQSGQEFLATWKSYWSQGASRLQLGTPTEKALLQAESALNAPRTGNTAVVLVTDGMPTCGANESVVASRLLQKKIKTYVVGLPGGTGVDNLDKIAIAGGTAPQGCTKNCYLTPVDVTEFQKSLEGIASTTVTTTTEVTIADCEFQLTPPTDAKANAGDVHLIVTEASTGEQFEVPRSDDAWTLSADAATATLQGVVCTAAKSGFLSSLSFQYGCVTVPEWKMPLL